MKNERRIATLLSLAALTAAAQAQVNTLAWTTDDDDDFGFFNTDAGVGVNAEGVVSTGNMRMALFDRSGNELDSRQVGDTDWPFLRIDTTIGTDPTKENFPSRYFDPQVEYHTQSGRLWMLYSEASHQRGISPVMVFGTGDDELSALHIAISKEIEDPNEFDSLGARIGGTTRGTTRPSVWPGRTSICRTPTCSRTGSAPTLRTRLWAA